MVVIHITGSEGCKRFIVQAVWRSGSCLNDVSFVKFEFYFTGNIFLSGFYECFDCIAKWCEPFSFVYDLSKLAAEFLFGFHGITVKAQLFELFVSCHQDRSARSFVYTTGFHANNTVFYNVNDTDAVFTAETVQLCDDLRNFHCLAIQCFWHTCFESHCDLGFFIRCFFRSNT